MVWGLRTKIFLAFVGLVLGASILNVGIAAFSVQNSLTSELIQRLVGNTKSEINDLTNFILIGDKQGIVSLIYNQKYSRKDLAYQIVLDENGDIVASTLINQDPKYFVALNVLPSGVNQNVELVTQADGQKVYDIALRLDYDKGILRAGYYKTQIDSSVSHIVFLLILGVVAALVAALGVAFFFTKSFFKPLDALKDAVEKVSAGDLSVKALVRGKDELGYLASAFNTMVGKLDASYQSLSSEQARLLASINSLSFGFIIASPDHTILLKNKALIALFEFTEQDVVTADLITSRMEGSFDVKKQAVQCTQTGTVCEVKEIHYGKKILRGIVAPVMLPEAGQPIGYVLMFEDITEAKILERSRDEFFSIASHELRTPLTAIRGNADMILEMYADKIVDADMKEMLSDINISSVRLIDIVNDFLEVSRLELGKFELKKECFDVNEVVSKVIRDLKALVEKGGIALVYAPPSALLPAVCADRSRVEQVLVNLVGNAVKFTRAGSITIRTEVVGRFLKLQVIDTGIGISADHQNLLFRKFQQAGESTLARDVTQGTGLGLYICRLLISGMGGSIALEKSEPGVGSIFSFTLPLFE